ncbi:MAG: helix-turn-helix transcriptional regulator [Gammaproteobacteria bacterium]|nr:MAG: helix-turn-helix transcriptional regulator [Gammaproteobacteria bacterium]
MAKRSLAKTALPPEITRALKELGEGLKIARQRRRQSQMDFAGRLMISRTTLQRMERGDPTVALGAWVAAAWLLGRLSDLQVVFDPDRDEAGKRMERQYLPRRGGHPGKLKGNPGGDLDNDF